jgi:hypothetical protein
LDGKRNELSPAVRARRGDKRHSTRPPITNLQCTLLMTARTVEGLAA